LLTPDTVIIFFKATGGAPELKQKKYKLQTSGTVQEILKFLKGQIRFKQEDPLVFFNIYNAIVPLCK
jgi:hypothetical protein